MDLDGMWDVLLSYVAEHTGFPKSVIAQVLWVEQEFWSRHRALRDTLLREAAGDDDSGCFPR